MVRIQLRLVISTIRKLPLIVVVWWTRLKYHQPHGSVTLKSSMYRWSQLMVAMSKLTEAMEAARVFELGGYSGH